LCFGLYWTSPTNVTKHVLLISSYFTTSPGGRTGGWRLEKSKIRLTQPSLIELGLGLSLAIKNAANKSEKYGHYLLLFLMILIFLNILYFWIFWIFSK
jgi:hypothetical protein